MKKEEQRIIDATRELERQRLEDAEDQSLDLQEDQSINAAMLGQEPSSQKTQFDLILETVGSTGDLSKQGNLTQEELGNCVFSVRFLQQFSDLARHYFDPIVKHLNSYKIVKVEKLKSIFEMKSRELNQKLLTTKSIKRQLELTKELEVLKINTEKKISELMSRLAIDEIKTYFGNRSQIALATSLSREGYLQSLNVTKRHDILRKKSREEAFDRKRTKKGLFE